MPLHRFIYSAVPGTIRDATQLFEGREPGTAFQTRHVRDEATIYGNDVGELIEENEPYFAEARNADQTGNVPDVSGNEIDGALCVDDQTASLAVLAFNSIYLMPETCSGHEGGDGVHIEIPDEYGDKTEPSTYWQGGDVHEITYTDATWPRIPHSNNRHEMIAFLVQIRLQSTRWHAGIFGIGSGWGTHGKLIHNEIVTGYGFRGTANQEPKIRIMCSMYGDQPRLIKEDDFLQTTAEITVTLPRWVPSPSTNYNPLNATVKIEIKGPYHWYGRIKITPLLVLDQVSRART